MLEHDKYWNWDVKQGEIILCNTTCDSFVTGEKYEVVYPQATPHGIVVKKPKTNITMVGEHSWFSKIDIKKDRREKIDQIEKIKKK